MFTLKTASLLLAFAGLARAEIHSLTLQQALEIAARQNPDVALARLDQQRAEEGIKVAQDPFHPHVYAGSGLAYTYGYPNSIEGNAPSLFQLRTEEALYNRPKSYQIAAAREAARGSSYGAQAKADEVAYQAADLFLTASQTEHESDTISGQLPSLQKVVEATEAAVSEGSQLPLELKRAQVNLAISQERVGSDRLDQDYYEMMLAVALGFPATDRVKPLDSDLPSAVAPPSEQEAADLALRNNRELRQMQSNVLAKQMDLRSYKAARLPQIDLVAQYALFAKYNYTQYFGNKFQSNNFQLGASITIPLLIGPASHGMAEQAYTDMAKLRIQMDQVRNRILTDTRRSYEQWQKAENIRNLYRMQLDLAREELTVLLAENGEGRIPMSQVEQGRLEEGNKWIALYDAEAQVTRAKLAILRQMGTLMATVREAGAGTSKP
ncbi:MAG TPA: TolC family protein [Bryobacteraceae bacterium]|nr:TolC family protein [Bryobacteraceae bacterium]